MAKQIAALYVADGGCYFGIPGVERMSKRQWNATPVQFRDLLISMARSVRVRR